jgi:hypothetical protein
LFLQPLHHQQVLAVPITHNVPTSAYSTLRKQPHTNPWHPNTNRRPPYSLSHLSNRSPIFSVSCALTPVVPSVSIPFSNASVIDWCIVLSCTIVLFQLIVTREGTSLSSGASGNGQVSLASCYFIPLCFIHHNHCLFMLSCIRCLNFARNPIKDCLLDFHYHSLLTLRGYLYG